MTSQRRPQIVSKGRRGRGLAIAAALAAPLALAGAAPGSASGRTIDSAVSTSAACDIVGGELTWGFKESFRSYISGTIANGSWEPTDGATYTTPDFGWSGATGTFDTATFAGEAHFTGGVHFTGHDGLLDTTIANPTLSFSGDGTAQLLLDLRNLTMEDALAGNTDNVHELTQVAFVALDLAAAPLQMGEDATTVTGTAVPTAVTQEGFDAFGSYEAGTAFDPVSFTLVLDCAEPEPTAEPTETADAAATPIAAETDEGADLGWLGWVAGIAGVGVVAAVVVWIIRRGRGGDANGSGPGAQA
ncbi:HtaA domain-containing protein [Microbacterium sp. 18062]|uniref:HtaA domain-containing protein n=1 Tax=Microbacterium sp. 18062 TaxID=2681410 RepID=UPI00135944DF|nr:HtaA domain-containing protein [Microbacterium sp. 18062]